MGNVIEFKKNDEQITEVVEVATSQLTEHSKQAEYSPPMSKKKWAEFTANVAANGLHHPIIATKGFKVIGNTYHYRAAKELGLENVKVIFEDIADSGVPSYMTNNTLQVPELKRGQKVALVIRLFYEEERQKAKARELYGKKHDPMTNWSGGSEEGTTRKLLAKKAGAGEGSIQRLLAVYRNRPDLEEKVFNGEYTINKAYTQMKADEEPEQEEVKTPIEEAKEELKKRIIDDSSQPQFREDEHELSPHNLVVRMRKRALSVSAEILDSAENVEKTDEDVKESAREQLLSLAKSCLITLGQTTEEQKDIELIHFGLELLDQINN